MTVRADDEPLLQRAAQHDIEVVAVDPPPVDMKASVQRAIEHIERSYQPELTAVWLLAPADMPGLTSQLIDHVLGAHQESQPAIIAPQVDARKGHPVLFPWSLAAAVEQLEPDVGIRELWEIHDGRTIRWQNARPLEDMDTLDDYERLQSQQGKRNP